MIAIGAVLEHAINQKSQSLAYFLTSRHFRHLHEGQESYGVYRS